MYKRQENDLGLHTSRTPAERKTKRQHVSPRWINTLSIAAITTDPADKLSNHRLRKGKLDSQLLRRRQGKLEPAIRYPGHTGRSGLGDVRLSSPACDACGHKRSVRALSCELIRSHPGLKVMAFTSYARILGEGSTNYSPPAFFLNYFFK